MNGMPRFCGGVLGLMAQMMGQFWRKLGMDNIMVMEVQANEYYRADIDSLRAIAVMAVVLDHISPAVGVQSSRPKVGAARQHWLLVGVGGCE